MKICRISEKVGGTYLLSSTATYRVGLVIIRVGLVSIRVGLVSRRLSTHTHTHTLYNTHTATATATATRTHTPYDSHPHTHTHTHLMIQVIERAGKGQLSKKGPDARTDVQASGLVSQASGLV